MREPPMLTDLAIALLGLGTVLGASSFILKYLDLRSRRRRYRR